MCDALCDHLRTAAASQAVGIVQLVAQEKSPTMCLGGMQVVLSWRELELQAQEKRLLLPVTNEGLIRAVAVTRDSHSNLAGPPT